MKGYKAFKKGMVCRGKQYEENTVFEEKTADLCQAGMHFCENPMDVLNYYPLVDDDCNITEFAEVESLGELKKDGTKCCTNKLRIGKKLSLGDWIKSVVSFVMDKTKKDDSSKLASSGNYAQLASSGDSAVIAGIGIDNIVKAKTGSFIVLAEYKYNSETNRTEPVDVKVVKVDGEKIKADTWYKLENGEFVEMEAIS